MQNATTRRRYQTTAPDRTQVVGLPAVEPAHDWHPRRRWGTIAALVASLISTLWIGAQLREARKPAPEHEPQLRWKTEVNEQGRPLTNAEMQRKMMENAEAVILGPELDEARRTVSLPCGDQVSSISEAHDGTRTYVCVSAHFWRRVNGQWVKR